MEHFDFICDDGFTSLRLLHRHPFDTSEPVKGLRVHVRCTDCVAALDINADSWSGFVDLFTNDYNIIPSLSWMAPAGEWRLSVERDEQGVIEFTSELDSLLDCHRWGLRTRFKMAEDRFRENSAGVLAFIGVWQ